MGSPPAWPQYPDLLPKTVSARSLAHRVVFSAVQEEHSLFLLLSCASIFLPIKSGILVLSYSARPFTVHPPRAQDRWPWVRGRRLGTGPVAILPEVYVCVLSAASHHVWLTSLPSASSLLLTCLLTCTDQLYQQLEQNRRLTNELKLALNED